MTYIGGLESLFLKAWIAGEAWACVNGGSGSNQHVLLPTNLRPLVRNEDEANGGVLIGCPRGMLTSVEGREAGPGSKRLSTDNVYLRFPMGVG
jgi:hypothetical protein